MAATAPLEHDLKTLATSFCVLLLLLSLPARAELFVVIVEGLGGEERYAEQFAAQVAAIERAVLSLGAGDRLKTFRAADVSRDAVIAHFAALESRVSGDDQVAVYLIGHGSFDDHEYKFNIQGPDLTGEDLDGLLDRLAANNLLLVNTGSASGALAELLQDEKRMLILATRSGVERHATRFGAYFADALEEPSADVNKNQVVSAAEAFAFAERQVDDYYERNGQLATEHPRLEGDRAERFSIARLGATRPARQDRELSALVSRRDALNADIEALRLAQDNMTPAAYRAELLETMIELAETEDAIEAREQELADEN